MRGIISKAFPAKTALYLNTESNSDRNPRPNPKIISILAYIHAGDFQIPVTDSLLDVSFGLDRHDGAL